MNHRSLTLFPSCPPEDLRRHREVDQRRVKREALDRLDAKPGARNRGLRVAARVTAAHGARPSTPRIEAALEPCRAPPARDDVFVEAELAAPSDYTSKL